MEDAAVYGGVQRGGLVDAAAGGQVGCDGLRVAGDSLLGWVAVGVLEGFAVELVGGGGGVAS